MEIKELKWERRLVWDVVSDEEKSRIFEFADDYKKFLSANKTEREVVETFVSELKAHGFRDISEGGDKVFMVNRGKALAAVAFGEKPLSEGVRIVASHIDVPRIDMKPVPLYEDTGIAMMDTHYYGGIKKFHWVARPLAIHGVVVKEDGRVVKVVFGESPDEPVLTIEDLLPHLARKAQYGKKIEEAIPGEKLNLIVGSIPLPDKENKDRVKLAILKLLNDKYGIVEEDFISAEIEIVPA
ncbi:MAG: aminopeptidase, partial [Candidatus Hydrothermota bacterium]